jgi:hypothetical protein
LLLHSQKHAFFLITFGQSEGRCALAIPSNTVPNAALISIHDFERGDRALVPVLDLSQDCLQIIGDSFFTFAGVLNLDEVMRKLSSPGVGQD